MNDISLNKYTSVFVFFLQDRLLLDYAGNGRVQINSKW